VKRTPLGNQRWLWITKSGVGGCGCRYALPSPAGLREPTGVKDRICGRRDSRCGGATGA
jgi:hypothetical protein